MRRAHAVRSGAAVLAAVSLLASCKGGIPAGSPAPEPVATVETATIATGQIEETLETLGRVEFDPKQTRTVAFVTSGRVHQVLVSPGQAVAAGTELLTLGPMPADSLEVQQTNIELAYARSELERLMRMRDRRLATNEQVQQAEKAVATAKAVLAGMGANHPEERDRGTRAQLAGVVREVLVTEGALVHAGEPAILLAPAGGVVIRAGFEIEDLGRLNVGLPATVEPVLDSGGRGAVDADVAELHRVVDPDTQLVEAVLHTASAPDWLLPGTMVRVLVVVHSGSDAVLVPRVALLSRDGVNGVFVIDGGHARWTPIEQGIDGGEAVEAHSGIAAGARVATTGRSVLSDGIAVTETGSGPSS